MRNLPHNARRAAVGMFVVAVLLGGCGGDDGSTPHRTLGSGALGTSRDSAGSLGRSMDARSLARPMDAGSLGRPMDTRSLGSPSSTGKPLPATWLPEPPPTEDEATTGGSPADQPPTTQPSSIRPPTDDEAPAASPQK